MSRPGLTPAQSAALDRLHARQRAARAAARRRGLTTGYVLSSADPMGRGEYADTRAMLDELVSDHAR